MMQYFTISEFAALRNVNINSLRYYEKKGLLRPAYIDERTKYRYYSTEQLAILDTIILCIDLGIALKDLTQYLDDQGVLQFQKLLVEGKHLAQQRMEKIQRNLNSIEFFLENVQQNKINRERDTVYNRRIRRRHMITTRMFRELPDQKQIELEVAKLYRLAQEQELWPILPANQLLVYRNCKEADCCFFLEVAVREKADANISIIPEGVYPCVTVDRKSSPDISGTIDRHWKCTAGTAVIVYNIHVDKCDFGNEPMELQMIGADRLRAILSDDVPSNA